MPQIHPVILCGGSGTRLWPKSRKSRPKPFIPLIGDKTLFRAALDRCSDPAQYADAIIVAGEPHVPLIKEQTRGAESLHIVVEPLARNTAPAIALAAKMLAPDAVMLVCPSDHHIADNAAFSAAAEKAAELARWGWLVSFGIEPDRPETGYGYLKRGETLGHGFKVAQFVEKPDLAGAERFLAEGGYVWNGGIFAFTAGQYLDELSRHRPDMAKRIDAAISNGSSDGNCLYPARTEFEQIEGESIDYALMENTDRAAMVPVDMGWSDIGNWAALQDALKADQNGNHAEGSVDLSDCTNTMILSDGPRVSAVGVKDICIIVDGDEILVTSRDGAQLVGKLPGANNQ